MMPLIGRRSAFAPPPTKFERQLVPVLSVLLASLTPLFPIIATAPILPPFGFMMMLAWRLLRADLWPAWVALPLGLFDDLFSGQPIGSAMALWTIALLMIDLLDTRMLWRDHWQDWGIAAGAIALELLLALVIAHAPNSAWAIDLIIPQIVISVLVFPLVARSCAALDRWQA